MSVEEYPTDARQLSPRSARYLENSGELFLDWCSCVQETHDGIVALLLREMFRNLERER